VAASPSKDLIAMTVSVRIPTTLRTLTGGQSEVGVEGANVRDVLASLEGSHPGFADRLLDDDGNLRRFVNVFVADDDIRFMDGLDTPVPEGETVSIIPAVAGG
jgi:molybdopterin synthase sulfur carrier subunit